MQRLIIAAILVASALLGGCAGMPGFGDTGAVGGEVITLRCADPDPGYRGLPNGSWVKGPCYNWQVAEPGHTGGYTRQIRTGSSNACRTAMEVAGIGVGVGVGALSTTQKNRLAGMLIGGAVGYGGGYLIGNTFCSKNTVEGILAGGGTRPSVKYYDGAPTVKGGVTCALRHNDRLVADFFDKKKNPEGIEIPSQGAGEQCRAAIERVRKQAGI